VTESVPPPEPLPTPLGSLADEAVTLRFQGLPTLRPETGVSDVLEGLREIRRRLDRVDEIVLILARYKGRATRALAAASGVAQDAWDRSSQQVRDVARGRGDTYVGPRERYADSNLATLAERRSERSAQTLVSMVEEAYDVARSASRGLDGVRSDFLAYLRGLQFESSLER
jgi:hypothetical protein